MVSARRKTAALAVLAILLPTSLLLGGRAYGQWRNFDQAQKLFQASDQDLENGRPREALTKLERSIALYPDLIASWEARSFCYCELGENDRALETLDEAIARFPKSPLLWGRKANLLRQLKRYEAASVAFGTAFALEPDNYIFQRLQRDCDTKQKAPPHSPR